MSEHSIDSYLKAVEALLEKRELTDSYHCKIKDSSMLRILHIATKRRCFVKEEHCEAYLTFLREADDNIEKQFDMVNETGYLVL